MRESLVDPLLKGHDALRAILGLEGGYDEFAVLHPDTGVPGQERVDAVQQFLQLGLSLRHPRAAVFRGLKLPANLVPQRGPAFLGDQVGLRVGVAPAVPEPDVSGTQGRARSSESAHSS